MDLFLAVLYGFISGFGEILPVSAPAHQFLFGYLTSFTGHGFLQLMAAVGCLLGVILCCWKQLGHMRRELYLITLPRKRRKRMPDLQAVSDFRIVVAGAIPIVLGQIFRNPAVSRFGNLAWLILTMSISGLALYLCQYLPHGSKDSRQLSPMDGLLLGVLCGLSVIPGISRIALVYFYCRSKRLSRDAAFELSLLFTILMLLCGVLFLTFGAISASLSSAILLQGLLACLAAFGGGVVGVRLMRYLVYNLDFHGISFYCWGFAIFCFIFYLIA